MAHESLKKVAVCGIVRNPKGELLILDPIHKGGWLFPGGMVERGESPMQACRREIEDEIGITITDDLSLLCVDHRGSTDEYIMFLFDAGTYEDGILGNIRVPEHLFDDYCFVSPEKALAMLRPNGARRLRAILDQGTARPRMIYLEDGFETQ